MDVAVGSSNPVKVRAVERALDGRDATVVATAVDSGVAEQPVGRSETVHGADTRASNALAATDADLGVGIEGGVAHLDGVDGLYLVMWATVTDGTRRHRGAGPSIRLPDRIATRVRDGEELGPILDDLLDAEGVATRKGAAGVLTDEIVDRESSLVHAVAGALGPFVSGHY